MASPTVASARQAVRRLIQDGQTSDSTPIPYKMVRLEDLSDQIQATPLTVFQVRFSGVPTENYVSVYVMPGTLTAYIDGSPSPVAPTKDADRNANFTLPVAPLVELQVTYGWQYFADSDIDDFVDRGRQWLREYSDVTQVPDGLVPALENYAAGEAIRALTAKLTLPSLGAGEATADLAKITTAYQQQADGYLKYAQGLRESYWQRADEPKAPAFDSGSLAIDPYQPRN